MHSDSYQSKALRTEAPITHEVVGRCISGMESMRIYFDCVIPYLRKLDEVKKWGFYGKEPKMFLPSPPAPVSSNATLSPDTILKYRLIHAVLGICTEAGELAERLMQDVGSNEFNVQNWIEEFGDFVWYLAIGADAVGKPLAHVLKANIAKLEARYPDKFTSQAAINRDIDAEMKALDNADAAVPNDVGAFRAKFPALKDPEGFNCHDCNHFNKPQWFNLQAGEVTCGGCGTLLKYERAADEKSYSIVHA